MEIQIGNTYTHIEQQKEERLKKWAHSAKMKKKNCWIILIRKYKLY